MRLGFARSQPIYRNYVSEIDRFLQEFDKRPEASSASRRAEEAKYKRIYALRDNPEAKGSSPRIWEDF